MNGIIIIMTIDAAAIFGQYILLRIGLDIGRTFMRGCVCHSSCVTDVMGMLQLQQKKKSSTEKKIVRGDFTHVQVRQTNSFRSILMLLVYFKKKIEKKTFLIFVHVLK